MQFYLFCYVLLLIIEINEMLSEIENHESVNKKKKETPVGTVRESDEMVGS